MGRTARVRPLIRLPAPSPPQDPRGRRTLDWRIVVSLDANIYSSWRRAATRISLHEVVPDTLIEIHRRVRGRLRAIRRIVPARLHRLVDRHPAVDDAVEAAAACQEWRERVVQQAVGRIVRTGGEGVGGEEKAVPPRA